MIKRILFVLFTAACTVIFLFSVFTIPFTGLYALAKWIITGRDDSDEIMKKPIDWILELPVKVFKYD